MDTAFPDPTPGPILKAERRQMGIAQVDLARRLEVHRVTLSGWEGEAAVDPIRAARYRRALRELVDEALAPTAEATA